MEKTAECNMLHEKKKIFRDLLAKTERHRGLAIGGA